MPEKIRVKDKKLKQIMRSGGRAGARKDFFELLRRAARNQPGKR